jgi:hypothetical protein
MVTNHRENQGSSELLISVTGQSDGWTVEVKRAGTVRYSDRGHKTRDAAWEAGRRFVKSWLRAQIGASGIGRRGERPAFREAGRLEDEIGPSGHTDRCMWTREGGPCTCLPLAPAPAPDPIAAPPAMPFVCTGCGQPSPGPLPGAPGDRVFCSKVDGWVPVMPAGIAWSVELGDPAAAPALEGEALCSCGHTDGVHLLGANTCAFEGCKCGEFTPAPSVEVVQ